MVTRFSSQVIALVQRHATEMLTSTCTLSRLVQEVGVMGEVTQRYDVVSSGVACRVIMGETSKNRQAESVGSRETLVETIRIILSVGTDVRVNDRLIVGVNTYDVIAIENSLTDGAYVSTICTRER